MPIDKLNKATADEVAKTRPEHQEMPSKKRELNSKEASNSTKKNKKEVDTYTHKPHTIDTSIDIKKFGEELEKAFGNQETQDLKKKPYSEEERKKISLLVFKGRDQL